MIGQEQNYLTYTLDIEQGLPCSYIDDVMTDDLGFLWITTSGGGICRYDGYGLITINASGEPSLRSSFAKNTAMDAHHRLWVASEGGIDIIDLEEFRNVDIGLEFPDPGDKPVNCFVSADSKGCMWILFNDYIYRLEFGKSGEVIDVKSLHREGLSDTNRILKDVDGDGVMWTQVGGKIVKINATGSGLDIKPVQTSLTLDPGYYLSDIAIFGGVVWIAGENGVFKLFSATGQWKHYTSSANDIHTLTQNFVTSLAVTQSGWLLASTLHGYNYYNPVSDCFERVGADIINCIKTDGENIIIATENEGVKFLRHRTISLENVPCGGAVNAIYQEDNGRLWTGVVEGGLTVREPGGHTTHLAEGRGGLSHNSVSALLPAGEGLMYTGTWGGGIDIVEYSGGALKRKGHLSLPEGEGDYIGLIEYDRRNSLLWIGTNRNIFIYDPSTGACIPATTERASGCIGSCIDSNGRLWVGCQEGCYVFNLSYRNADGTFPYVHYRHRMDDPASAVAEKICCIMEARSGEIYLGSNGGGFYRANILADGGINAKNISTRDGLSNDRVRGFCEDSEGNIWISTEYGLNCYNPGNGSITPYYHSDGLANTRFHWNNSFTGTDGLLYFGHADGYTVLDPSKTRTSPTSIPVRLSSITIGDETRYTPYLEVLSIMEEKDRPIRLSFSAPQPSAVSDFSYSYIMEGLDEGWTRLKQGTNEAIYNSIPGGNYTFRVQASDHDGRKVGEFAMAIRVKKKFYHTELFSLFLMFLMVIGVYVIILWRTAALRKRQAVLEETVEQRTMEISRQKRLVEEKVEVLQRQNEELASRKILFSEERRNGGQEEDDFVQKALDTIRQIYKKPDLDVNMFCQAMGMSKTLLNSKIQESLGQSTGQFIRTFRLSVAKEILESETGMNISEVAYEVGFNDPKYFTRCFTKEFGVNPSSINAK